jgi:hypothetical protein
MTLEAPQISQHTPHSPNPKNLGANTMATLTRAGKIQPFVPTEEGRCLSVEQAAELVEAASHSEEMFTCELTVMLLKLDLVTYNAETKPFLSHPDDISQDLTKPDLIVSQHALCTTRSQREKQPKVKPEEKEEVRQTKGQLYEEVCQRRTVLAEAGSMFRFGVPPLAILDQFDLWEGKTKFTDQGVGELIQYNQAISAIVQKQVRRGSGGEENGERNKRTTDTGSRVLRCHCTH